MSRLFDELFQRAYARYHVVFCAFTALSRCPDLFRAQDTMPRLRVATALVNHAEDFFDSMASIAPIYGPKGKKKRYVDPPVCNCGSPLCAVYMMQAGAVAVAVVADKK